MEIMKGYKQTELGVLPEDWEVKKLSDYAFITKLAGFEYTLHFNSYKDEGEIIVVRGTNITNNKLDLNDIKTIPFATSNYLQRSKLFKNDLVFAYVGTIGPIFLVEENDRFHLGPNTAKISVNKELHSMFLFHYFTSSFIKREITEHTSIGAQPSLSMSKIRSFKIIFPSKLTEQISIAKALSDADAYITSLEKLIEKKRHIKQGVMQELLKPKDGWISKTLGESSEVFRGGSPRPIESFLTTSIEGINWIKIGDVKKNAKYIESTDEKIIPEGLSKSRLVNVGDFLLSNSMSYGRPYILKTNGCIHDGWLVIQNYQKHFNTDFLYYLLGSELVINQYKSLASGSSVLNLNKEIVKGVALSYPDSLQEQEGIANILIAIDDEINSLENKLQKAKSVKLGMMQNLLTGKIRLV